MADERDRPPARTFPTTRPSAILGLHSPDPKVRSRSLEQLVRLYWRPVYKHVRLRWRKDPDQAHEITQEFFLRSLDGKTFQAYEPERGHFRTFLRVCLDRFVVDLGRKSLTQKRGQGVIPVPLDPETLEEEIREGGDSHTRRHPWHGRRDRHCPQLSWLMTLAAGSQNQCLAWPAASSAQTCC